MNGDVITRRKQMFEAVAAFVVFGGVSLLGRFVPFAIHLMGMLGLIVPLAWGKHTGRWAEMGFTRRHWGSALLWGVGAGVATSLIGYVTVEEHALAPMLGLRLAVGVPLSLLLPVHFRSSSSAAGCNPDSRRHWASGEDCW